MSRRKDPIVAVLDYFETADLLLAQQALALAQAAVRRRLPKGSHPAGKSKLSRKRNAEGSLTTGATAN